MKNFAIILFSLFSTIMLGNNTDPVKSISKVDTDASSVQWTGKKVTGQHEGTIKLKEGALEFDKGSLVGGSFTIDMTTIVCTDLDEGTGAKLVGHLSSDDFFGVPNHPTATFVITKVASAATKGAYEVTGDLTIKGITHPLTFEAQVDKNSAKATLVVDRTKYDIKYGSGSFFDGLGDKMIYDDFDLALDLRF